VNAAATSRALDDLRVVEVCTGIGGAYAGRLLADLGAEVIKVEPPAGDPLRVDAEGSAPPGALFDHLNAGKRGACLDVCDPAAADAVSALLAAADLVVVDAEAGLAEKLVPVDIGTGRHGRALVVLSDFGGRGPYQGRPTTDLTLQALAGWVSPRGRADVLPVQVGLRAHQYVVGTQAAVAGLTALRSSRITGRRVTTTVSRMEAIFNTVAYDMLRHQTLVELGYKPRWTAYIPGLRRCQDGWIAVNCLTGQHWQDMCALLDVMEYADSYTEMRFDGVRLAQFYERIDPWFAERQAQEALELFQAFRVPASPVGDGRTLPEFAQYRARNFFERSATGVLAPRSPLRLGGSPPPTPAAPPPPPTERHTEPSGQVRR
jgi:crotonobetainyl-CoA:carnitine CoA-transferase CaiB-like acyl-CoA transferase